MQASGEEEQQLEALGRHPMADAGMTTPEKKTFLKLLLIIQLLIATIGGITFTIVTTPPLRVSVLNRVCQRAGTGEEEH